MSLNRKLTVPCGCSAAGWLIVVSPPTRVRAPRRRVVPPSIRPRALRDWRESPPQRAARRDLFARSENRGGGGAISAATPAPHRKAASTDAPRAAETVARAPMPPAIIGSDRRSHAIVRLSMKHSAASSRRPSPTRHSPRFTSSCECPREVEAAQSGDGYLEKPPSFGCPSSIQLLHSQVPVDPPDSTLVAEGAELAKRFLVLSESGERVVISANDAASRSACARAPVSDPRVRSNTCANQRVPSSTLPRSDQKVSKQSANRSACSGSSSSSQASAARRLS